MSRTWPSWNSESAKSVSSRSFCSTRAVGALEVEACSDFLVGLIDRIADFDQIGFGDDIERGHAEFRKRRCGRG